MPTNAEAGKVGYGRPPEHTQFKPGQSGNPKGRPRKQEPKPGEIDVVIHQSVEKKFADLVAESIGFEPTVAV